MKRGAAVGALAPASGLAGPPAAPGPARQGLPSFGVRGAGIARADGRGVLARAVAWGAAEVQPRPRCVELCLGRRAARVVFLLWRLRHRDVLPGGHNP